MSARSDALGSAALRATAVDVPSAATAKDARVRVRALAAFIGITYLWSWGCWALLILANFEPFSGPWSMAYVAGLSGPSVAAVLTRFVEDGSLGLRWLLWPLTHWKVTPKAYLAALIVPPTIAVIAALGYMPLLTSNTATIALTGVPALFLKMLVRGGPLNEEVGWRGYLLPSLLSRMSPFAASLVMWPVWGLWHLPLWIIPGVQHDAWPIGLFMLLMLPFSFAFTAIYRAARGSLLPPILLHTVVNVTMYFSPLLAIYHRNIGGFFLRLNALWFMVIAAVIIKQGGWFSAPQQKSSAS
jgi:membrane protease YdiL (CAAX protease family)